MKVSRKRKVRSKQSSLSRNERDINYSSVNDKREWNLSPRSAVHLVLGVALALYLGRLYVQHTYELHENELWFSHITELEREISFRTEAALYYSYYKQIVEAPSLIEGFLSLIHDNSTEHGHAINAIQRFNIFQEMTLAVLYRLASFQKYSEAIFFYVNSVFILQGVYAVALYFTTWLLSGSIIGGALAFIFFFFNRIDATRVEYAISLRESFALPFIALQLFFITAFLRAPLQDQSTYKQSWIQVPFFMSSLSVALTWQFAQFVFLLEACALLLLYAARLTSQHKIKSLMLCYTGVLFIAFVLQFFNTMLLTSPVFGITTATIVIFTLQDYSELLRKQSPFFMRMLKIPVLLPVFVITLAICINLVMKIAFDATDGDHIISFVMAKLGLHTYLSREFELLLYLCQPAFQCMSKDTLLRLASTLLLPCYSIVVVLLSVGITCQFWRVLSIINTDKDSVSGTSDEDTGDMCAPSSQNYCENTETKLKTYHRKFDISPEFAYHLLLSAAFGVVALYTQRFKVMWVPHMCVLTAGTLANFDGWSSVLQKVVVVKRDLLYQILHFTAIGCLISAVVLKELPTVMSDMNELRVFHDPDTVELMQWISANTSQGAVFGGSMQLLAGVRLCTGRSITNHPHFENKALRERTMHVYKVYGRWTPEEVYSNLSQYGTDYIIIENSICFANKRDSAIASTSQDNCRLVDIMDQVQKGKKTKERFCDAIRHLANYREHFRLIFENNTFRVYQLV